MQSSNIAKLEAKSHDVIHGFHLGRAAPSGLSERAASLIGLAQQRLQTCRGWAHQRRGCQLSERDVWAQAAWVPGQRQACWDYPRGNHSVQEYLRLQMQSVLTMTAATRRQLLPRRRYSTGLGSAWGALSQPECTLLLAVLIATASQRQLPVPVRIPSASTPRLRQRACPCQALPAWRLRRLLACPSFWSLARWSLD